MSSPVQTGATLLANNSQHFFCSVIDRRSVAQQCSIRLHMLLQHCWGHARSLCMVYKDLWVVSLPRCTAGPSIAGSCCIRLHTAANTYATIPNIVGSCCVRLHAASGVRCKHCRRYKPEVKRGTPENRA